MRDLLKEQLRDTAMPLLETRRTSLHYPGLGLFDVIIVGRLASQSLAGKPRLHSDMEELDLGWLSTPSLTVLSDPSRRAFYTGRM